MKKKTDDEILLQLYCEVYAISEPNGDFIQLMENAELDEFHQKVIEYWNYEVLESEAILIHKNIMNKYKVPNWKRKMFWNTFLFGVSPKFKN